MHEDHRAKCATKIQALARGREARNKVSARKRLVAREMMEKDRKLLAETCTRIQCAFRKFLARRRFRALLFNKIKKVPCPS